MSNKLISIIVSCALVLSLALVGVIGVSAAIDTDGSYVPSEGEFMRFTGTDIRDA